MNEGGNGQADKIAKQKGRKGRLRSWPYNCSANGQLERGLGLKEAVALT